MPELRIQNKGHHQRIFYVDSEEKRPWLILLHGLAGNHTLMNEQFLHFSSNYRVIVPDLPGHGGSEPATNDTIQESAQAIQILCDQLQVRNPVLIGHSFGGIVGLELMRTRALHPKAIALLDAPMLIPPQILSSIRPLQKALRSGNYAQALSTFMDVLFFSPFDNPVNVSRIKQMFLAFARDRFLRLSEEMNMFPAEEALAQCECPLFYLKGAVPLDLERLMALVPQALYGQAVATGHFLQIEVPGQVNGMIDRFLQVERLLKTRKAA